MAGISVGSVSVSVVPDARGWNSKLKAQIMPAANATGKEIGKSIGDSISKGVEDGVDKGLDKGGAKSRAKGAKTGDSYGGAFGDAVRKRVSAALKTLPDAKVDGDLSPVDRKLTELKARLENISNLHLGVDVEDTIALGEIENLKRELAELSHNASSVSVRVNSAAALAQLEAMSAEVNKLDHSKAEIKVDVDKSALNAASSELKKVESAGNGAHLSLLGVAAALSPALVPVATALAGGILAIGAAGAAAGVGFGAFAAVSVKSWKDIQDAAKQASKGNTEALDSLSAEQKTAAVQLATLESTWARVSKSLEPITLPIETRGLRVVTNSLGLIKPLVEGAAPGVDHLTRALDSGFKGDTLHAFVGFVQRQAGPAISAFSDLALGIGSGIASMFVQTEKFLPGIDRTISNLGTSIANFGKSDAFATFLDHVSQDVPVVIGFVRELGKTFGELIVQAEPIGRDVLSVFTQDLPIIQAAIKGLGSVLRPVSGFLAEHSGLVTAMATAYAGLRVVKAADTVAGIAASIGRLAAANPVLAAVAAGIGLITYAIQSDSQEYAKAVAPVEAYYKKQQGGLNAFDPSSLKKTVTAVTEYDQAAQKAFENNHSEGNLQRMNKSLQDFVGTLETVQGASQGLQSLSTYYGMSEKAAGNLAKTAGVSQKQLIQYGTDFTTLMQRMQNGDPLGNLPEKVSKEFGDITGKIGNFKASIQTATPTTSQLQQAMKTLGDSMADPVTKLQALNTALAAYDAQTTGTLVSQSAAFQAVHNTVDSLKKANVGQIIHNDLSKASDATLTAASNMGSLRQAIDANVTAYAQNKISGKELIATTNQIGDSFVDQAVKAGVPRAAAEALRKTYLSVPKNVLTKFGQNGAEGVGKAADTARQKATIAGKTYTLKFNENGSVTVEGAADKVQKKADAIVKEYTAYIKQNGADGVASKAGYVKARLEGLPKDVAINIKAVDYATSTLNTIRATDGSVIATRYVDTVARNRVGGTPTPSFNAAGGYITGPGTGTSDSIPARLSNGEYVIRAKQTAKYKPLLDAINSGKNGYANGGLVGGGTVGFAAGGPVDLSSILKFLRSAFGSLTGSSSVSRINDVGNNQVSRIKDALGNVVSNDSAAVKSATSTIASEAKKQEAAYKAIAKARATLNDKKATQTQRRNARVSLAQEQADLKRSRAAVDRARQQVAEAKAQGKLASAAQNALVQSVRAVNRQLQTLANQRDAIAKKLADARSFAADISSAARSGALADSAAQTGAGVQANLSAKASAAKRFVALLRQMSGKGFNKSILSQVVAMGVQDGTNLAAVLVKDSKAQVRALNGTQNALNYQAGILGNVGTSASLGNGASTNYIGGLQSQLNAKDRQLASAENRAERVVNINNNNYLTNAAQIDALTKRLALSVG